VVSYHESLPVQGDDDEDMLSDPDELIPEDDEIVIDTIDESESNNGTCVTFDETVMASIIAEATTEADDDQFIGASFA
jgi:hypothetical protein